jgi:hypothetical protein
MNYEDLNQIKETYYEITRRWQDAHYLANESAMTDEQELYWQGRTDGLDEAVMILRNAIKAWGEDS